MPRVRQEVPTDWQAVLAKATAFLCLYQADMKSAPMLDKAKFLMRFGLSRPQAAQLLGTTDGSLRVLADRAKPGAKRHAKKTTTKKATTKKAAPRRRKRVTKR
jgi:hypothetical protein